MYILYERMYTASQPWESIYMYIPTHQLEQVQSPTNHICVQHKSSTYQSTEN